MKRHTRTLAAALLAGASLGLAQGAAAQEVASIDGMKSGDTWELVFGSASATGTYFAGMSALAAMISQEMPNVRATATVSPGSAVEVFPQLQRAERAGGMHVSYDLEIGYKGEATFEGRDIPVCTWFFAQEAPYNVFVLAKHGITTVEELDGSGLVFGGPVVPIDPDRPERWDQAFAFMHALLTAHGVDPFEDVEVEAYNTSESIEQLGNATIDGMVASRALGSGAISELMTRQEIVLLQPNPDKVDEVEATFPVYAKEYSREAYPGLQVPDPGLGFFHGVYATLHRDLPDDLVYDLTKTVWENIDVLRNAHPAYQVVKLEDALKGVTVPPHPGALKYYLEHDVPGAQEWADRPACG
jgi:uncharacterized protein